MFESEQTHKKKGFTVFMLLKTLLESETKHEGCIPL